MSDSSQSASSWTRQAINEIESGEIEDARAMLAAALRLDSAYQPAWLWFASIASDDGEKRYCFEHAERIGSNAAVESALVGLANVPAITPPELADLEDPPIPEEYGGAKLAPSKRNGVSRWLVPLLAGIAALVGTALLLYFFADRKEENTPVVIAMAVDLTGPGAIYGSEMRDAVALYVKRVNARGGIQNHPIHLIVYDDEGTSEGAVSVANQIVEDGEAIAVIGHRTSAQTIAAIPIYEAAEIPVISGTATADELSVDHDWFFRTIFTGSDEGEFLAAYLTGVLDYSQAIVVMENESYGSTLASGFTNAFSKLGGEVVRSIVLESDTFAESPEYSTILQTIDDSGDDVPLIIAADAVKSQEVVLALSQSGRDPLIYGGDSMSSSSFLSAVEDAADSSPDSWSVTNGIHVVAPLLIDSLSGDAVNADRIFFDEYGSYPTWRGLYTVDAALAVITTLGSENFTFDPDQIGEERLQLRDGLKAVNSQSTAIPGLAGPMYFDLEGDTLRSMSMGVAHNGEYESAPVQLRLVNALDTSADLQESSPIVFDGKIFLPTRVVFSGIEINQIRNLDLNEKSFFADFFVWFNYAGDDDAVDVFTPNIADFEQFSVQEVRTGQVDGLNYKVFRFQGKFVTKLDFRDFPFDQQVLEIKIQNRTLPASDVIYAVDREFRDQPMSVRLLSGANSGESIVRIQNWNPTSLTMYESSLGTTSNLGDSSIASTSGHFEYSQLIVETVIDRDAQRFLIKNLLPLSLIALITYISLFFSHDQTTERVSFGITGVLTGAVLLSGVWDLLPEVGYTVAIEWAYYGFMVLSGLTILVALIGGKLYRNKQITEMRALDTASRILYPLALIGIVLAYWVQYG